VSVGIVSCTRVPAQRSGQEHAPGRLEVSGRTHSTRGAEPIGPYAVVVGHA
jgi:hypothetical protein